MTGLLPQILFGSALAALLVGLGVYFGWRQVQTLRALPHDDTLSPEDRRYTHNQAWRRLATCACMFLLAGFLMGALLFLEEPAQRLADARDPLPQVGSAENPNPQPPPLTEEQRRFAKFYTYWWISTLLVLLLMLTLAAFDILAIRRYGRRHLQKIHNDRRAMIERQLARLRQERNGHHE